MSDESFTIEVKCLFCGSTLQGPEDAEYKSGDLIECHNCGESSDYDSLIEVAKEKATDVVKDKLDETLSKTFKNLFK